MEDHKDNLVVILSQRLHSDRENFGNARLVRNLIERGICKQALPLFKRERSSRDELMLILPQDIKEEEE